jgi:hypothetical protein
MSSSFATALAKLAANKDKTKDKNRLTQTKQITKKYGKRVVKRPARGYHRFRNGILNVVPKGGEKKV